MSTTQKPDALRLADIVERLNVGVHSQAIAEEYSAAARELRSQHARITDLEAQLSAIGAGGVEPLRNLAAPADVVVADERKAFEQWLGIMPCGAAHDFGWEAWKARASLAATPAAGELATLQAGLQAARRAPTALVPQGYKITEEQHVAAVKVLHRAAGVDGLPQRMIDAMLAAAPQSPEAAQLDDINVADMYQVFDLKGEE